MVILGSHRSGAVCLGLFVLGNLCLLHARLGIRRMTMEDGERELRLDRPGISSHVKAMLVSRDLWQYLQCTSFLLSQAPTFFSFRCPLIAHDLCAVRRFQIDVQCYIHS